MLIKLTKSALYNVELTKKRLCNFILKAKQLSIGKYCKMFEKKFAQRQWRKYCVFVNSWSSANLLLIQALLNMWRIKKWDKIWFSSLTWSTNVMPIIQLGLIPIPLDVSLHTLNVNIDEVKKTHKTHKLKWIFLTNLLWFCDNTLDQIAIYCKQNWILLLEDNCESLWTVYKWKKLWNYSLASTFSTYVAHHLSTIEWGMVCTDDEELYVMMMMTREHGRDRNLPDIYKNKIRSKYNLSKSFYANYSFYTLGFNFRPTEIWWFIWCQQLLYLDKMIKKRQQNFLRFVKLLNKNGDFYLLDHKHLDFISSFSIPLICKTPKLLEFYVKKFSKAWVEIRPIVGGDMTQQFFWKDLYGSSTAKTNSSIIHKQGFYFGNSPEFTNKEINFLEKILYN
jgi:CDP-4-dehydro-6-deoxyglucose reductase, E1